MSFRIFIPSISLNNEVQFNSVDTQKQGHYKSLDINLKKSNTRKNNKNLIKLMD